MDQKKASFTPKTKADKIVHGLGWLSIGIGVAEVLMPRTLARTLGIQGREALLRGNGVREIIAGVGILTSRNAAPWIWGRVVGDVLNASTLVINATHKNSARNNVALALGALVGMAALDFAIAKLLTSTKKNALRTYDDNDRNDLVRSPESLRGLALNDFHIPADMRAQKLLQTKPIQTH